MKRLFLLIPVLALFSLMANATKTPISPTSPYDSDALRLALYYSSEGDTIVMNAGTYEESNTDFIAWKRSNVVMAAEGASVTIKPHVSFRVRNGARAELIGVKIDASELTSLGSYEDIFQAGDANDGNRLILEGCEIYGNVSKTMLRCASDKKLDSLIINNCYIHDNAQATLRLQSTSLKGVIITNTTIANVANGGSFWCAPMDISSTASDAKVIVDHCTFYHNTSISSSYADVTVGYDGSATSDVTITNCIFAQPESYSGSRAINLVNGGTVRNCLTFNYTKSTNGIQGATVKENCIAVDPLFTDAANADYSFPGNWVTMSLSPARGAATDGSDLGDPRWYSAETLPSTNFASAYDLLGNKAQLNGNIELNASNHIKYKGSQVPGTAKWKLHITKACAISVVADRESGSTSGCTLTLTVYDADGNEVDAITAARSDNDNDINIGSLSIPEEGDYTIVLSNSVEYSGAILEKITLSYVGGAVQNMPGTTDVDEAWFSSNGTRADGKISYSSISSGCWAKWNIAVASAGTYNVTVNIQNVYGHNYTVEFLKEGSDTPLSVSEGETTYGHDATLYPVAVGAIALEAGNYVMTVSNSVGDAALLSTTLSYAGGAAVDLSKSTPASLLANADAILSDDWSIEGGKITHAESKATTGWAKWNVDCADYGNYNVTINISSDNGHGMKVEIFEDEAESAIYTLSETSYSTGDLELDLGNIVLDDREYVVKVSNTVSSSHAEIESILITYLNGARATLPATCTFSDLMLSAKAHITESNLWFNTIGDSNPVDQWAKWNVKVASAGTFLFTMNVSSTNGQSYKISILDMDENELDAFESGSVGSGDKTVKNYFNLAAGNYIVKLENTYSWSQGHISSLVVTQPSLITIDEAATSNSVIHDNYRDGNHDIQITRTITSGMYNTICLPFDVSSAQLQSTFGSDVTLLTMSSASVSGDVLELEFDDATSINRGTPYLIKTTKTVSNPVFTDVEIKAEEGDATGGVGFDADFIGSFIKSTIDASEYNLFLGANDKLYFSNNAVTLKGLRAYFQIKDNGTGAPVRKARIVEQHKVVTELELIDGEWQDIKSANGIIKTIENGQLILIRDGKRYNVMGIRF